MNLNLVWSWQTELTLRGFQSISNTPTRGWGKKSSPISLNKHFCPIEKKETLKFHIFNVHHVPKLTLKTLFCVFK